jgi:very-short-patch-repair endonuclease
MTIKEALQTQRRVLLDLTYRNRLLNLPKKPSNRSITVHDELSEQILRLLIDKKALSFTAIRGDSDEEQLSTDEQIQDDDATILIQPEDEDLDANGIAVRHSDTKLQTKLKSEYLQKRLLEIYYESRMMLEEQGVNVLYLALGQLRFRERAGSDEFRNAPLVLMPVTLERKSARDRFVLKWNEEDPQENLSLREKLRVDFGIQMPEFPDADGFDLVDYFESIREAVALQDGWEVIDDAILLGFFSFSKLLMFLDLDPGKWPQGKGIDENALVSGLLGDGFSEVDVGMPSGESAFLDEIIPVSELKHIMDCDSSQALAIEAVRRGQNLVIQGPPGTGKSQTIANLIATAVSDGRKVLFVAEKMAALEVVKRRLANVGLGPLCLELHSNKANKKAVLEELGRTMGIGRPARVDVAGSIERLDQIRTQLNDHARKMHAPSGAAQLSPFRIVSSLSKLLPRTGRPSYRLPDAAAWTMADAEKRASTIREVCEYLPQVGNPSTNRWRGVGHPPVMRPQAEDLVAGTTPLSAALVRTIESGDVLASGLGLPSACNLADLVRQCSIGETLAKAPAFDRSTIRSGVWTAGVDALREALRSGRILSTVHGRRTASVSEVAWDTDWLPQRQIIAGHGRSLFRWMNGSYRLAINQLRGVMTGVLPKDYKARLALMDDLIAGHKARIAVHGVSATAKSAFGSVWRDQDTDWDLAESILGWVEQQSMTTPGVDLRQLAAELDDRPALSPLVATARAAIAAAKGEFASVVETLRLGTSEALDGVALEQADLHLLSERTAQWTVDLDGLMTWLSFAEVKRRAEAQQLKEVVASFADAPDLQRIAVDQFWTAFYLEMLSEASKAYPELAKFDGRRHEELIQQFREWDRQRLSIAQVEAAQAHFEGMPKASIGAVGTLGTLRSEIARKRGHMALRKLLKMCGSPIQAVKPVFMMSPLSVAQFLEPGAIEFDLLVIDEASQVEPIDALGAIARCKQVVVVGDDKQLPPTSFFSRIVGGDDMDEQEEGAQAKDLESVLSLCAAKGLPQRMLQWHYRSRHESLIAVSNKEFYEGNLFIVPSPDRAREQTGLRFHHFPQGRFDRGNSYKNHVEAVAIAQAVVDHARNFPGLTLGVGAMSVRQRQAITDEIELARRQHPELEHFISKHPHEPFFVKNLENIQGDERDVIFISIGYGRAKNDDKMYQNFGPLNADGGHRRLNVLITRARERCEVFSSICADDIRVDERSKLGVIALKTYLKYAESGDLGVPLMTGKGADSPFEEAVQELLVKHGFQVDNQVGVAGFFIDLAIVDPETPGRYLLGLECDGATYHSAPSARDRDRLRQEILEAHGWSIHRIWSTDWFQRAKSETDRLLNAIAAAKSERRATMERQDAPKPVASPRTEIKRDEAKQDAGLDNALSQPYCQADFVPGNAHLQPHEVPVGSMSYTVERIIEVEGPIHEEEIVARVRDLWGLGRAGSRIQAAVKDALRHASRKGRFSVEADCYRIVDATVPVRDRSEAASRTLKKPELLPPQEIREAIVGLVREAHGLRREETATAVSRMLGFQATSQQLRERIEQQVELLVSNGSLEQQADILTVEVV